MVKLLTDIRGNVLIETSIILPFLVIAVFGVVDITAVVRAKRSIESASFIVGEAIRYNRDFNPTTNQSNLWSSVFYPSLGGLAESSSEIRVTRITYINNAPVVDWSIANRGSVPSFNIGSVSANAFSNGSTIYIVDSSFRFSKLASQWLVGTFSISSKKIHSGT